MDFFLSYHHDDKRLAGRVKQELIARGSTGFLAHEDINISKTWREEILRNLRSCTALVAIVTPNFARSVYANQEAGYVLSKGRPVISFNFDNTELPGFLESIQAVPTSEANIGNAVDRAIEVIRDRDPTVFIEPSLKTSQEAEKIAVDELLRHIKRLGGEIRESNITIPQVKLENETKVFVLSGTAESILRESGVTRHYRWGWGISIDARTGVILSKSATSIQF